jgi:hypothetical protein
MKQAYLISSNPSIPWISSDLSESLDSVKEATGFTPCRPVTLEDLVAVYGKVPSSGWGMTVEQLLTVFETLKTKTTRASEILAVFTKLRGITSQKTGT